MPNQFIASDVIHASIVHKISDLFKMLYQNAKGLPKVDKYGIRSKTESTILICLRLAIKAALMKKLEKIALVKELKIEIETVKQFIRLEFELSVLKEKNYFVCQEKLQEISKMTSGWIEHLQQKELDQKLPLS